MELNELIKLLLRRKYYLIIIPFVSGVIAFALRFSTDRLYVSESQISTGLTIKDIPGEGNAYNPIEIAISFSNLTENMTSKTVTYRMSYNLLLHDLTTRPFRNPNFSQLEIQPPVGDTLETITTLLKEAIQSFTLIPKSSENGTYLYDLIEAYEYDQRSLKDGLRVSRVGNTDFVNIVFISEVPALSAYVVNTWAEEFIDYYNYQKTGRLNESLAVLSQLIDDKQKALDAKVQQLNRYNLSGIVESNDETSSKVEVYEGLIRDEESNVRALNLRLANIREQIAQITSSSNSPNRTEIISLKSRIDQLSTRLINDSDNTGLRDSLDNLRDRLQEQMYRTTASSNDRGKLDDLFEQENELEVSYQIALEDLSSLKEQYQIQRGDARNKAAKKSIVENLQTEVQQAREDFISAQNKFSQAKSELLVGSNSLKLSYYGDVPEKPQSRKTIIFTIVGLVVGFVITLFMVVAIEFLDTRLKNPSKFKRETRIDPTGIIGSLHGFDGDLAKLIHGDLSSADLDSARIFLQTFRKLRFKIQSLKGHTILFTSLRSKSGKSFVLSALAHSLSLIDRKILIIDTNFKNSEISDAFKDVTKKYEEPGLNLLIKNPSIVKSAQNINRNMLVEAGVIKPTMNQNIDIIRSKNIPSSPSEVLFRINIGKIIDSLLQEYDFIMLEGANLNEYSDSEELTNFAEYIVPVFSVNDEFQSKDKKSLEFLYQLKDRISLTILNEVKDEDIR